MRPRIARSVAKRLDRLARRAHRFHQFAHHPLCQRYQGELIALGRKTRICRGCTFAVLGFVAGVVLALCTQAGQIRETFAWQAAAMALVCSVGYAGRRALRSVRADDARRSGKLIRRFLPALVLTLVTVGGVRAVSVRGLTLATAAMVVVGLLYASYRRRGPDRGPCATCPERALSRTCSGFQPIVRRERAFARLSRRLLITF
jgi:hypothetical protein